MSLLYSAITSSRKIVDYVLGQYQVPNGAIHLFQLNRMQRFSLLKYLPLKLITNTAHTMVNLEVEGISFFSHLSNNKVHELITDKMANSFRVKLLNRVYIIHFEELITELGKITLMAMHKNDDSAIKPYLQRLFNVCLKEAAWSPDVFSARLNDNMSSVFASMFKKNRKTNSDSLPYRFESPMLCSSFSVKLIANAIFYMNFRIWKEYWKNVPTYPITVDDCRFKLISNPFGNYDLDKITPDDIATRFPAIREIPPYLGQAEKIVDVDAA